MVSESVNSLSQSPKAAKILKKGAKTFFAQLLALDDLTREAFVFTLFLMNTVSQQNAPDSH
jgi:hypothetical protein